MTDSDHSVTKTSTSDAFLQCFDDYYRIISEESEEVVWEKKQIQERFANHLQALANFQKSRLELIYQEALYLQQLREDQKET
jgi:hypothetical protein